MFVFIPLITIYHHKVMLLKSSQWRTWEYRQRENRIRNGNL